MTILLRLHTCQWEQECNIPAHNKHQKEIPAKVIRVCQVETYRDGNPETIVTEWIAEIQVPDKPETYMIQVKYCPTCGKSLEDGITHHGYTRVSKRTSATVG